MGDTGIFLVFVIWSAVVGAFFCWGLWWIAAKVKPVAESDVARRAVKAVGLLIGIGLPSMAALGSVAHLFL